MSDDSSANPEHRPIFEMEADFWSIKLPLVVIALGVVVGFLHLASGILLPVALAIFLSYVLSPAVYGLTKLSLPRTEYTMPRSVAALIVVLLAVGLTVFVGILLSYQVRHLGNELPKYRKQIAKEVTELRDNFLNMRNDMERFMRPLRRESPGQEQPIPKEPGNAADSPDPGAQASELVKEVGKRLETGGLFGKTNRQLWWQASSFVAGKLTGALGILIQVFTAIFVLYFTLLEAPTIRERLIATFGKTEQKKNKIIQLLDDVHDDIQDYLFGRFAINTSLAIVVSLVFYIYGLNYALLIGIVAGLFNFIPYVGPLAGTVIPFMVAFMQFGTWTQAFLVGGIYLGLTGIEGNLITPIVLGRQLRLNSLVVLLALIFWGWLWGIVGMILTLPIMAVIRTFSEYIDGLEPLAELLRGKSRART